MNSQFNKEHEMQNLTLQMAKAAPVRQQMASQDNANNAGADQTVSGAPNAFADMLKKQVRQKEAKANEAQETLPNAKENVNQAAKTGREQSPQEASQVANENAYKELNEKINSEDAKEAVSAPIQDVILMQMGLQSAAQINPNQSASTNIATEETAVDSMLGLPNTGIDKSASLINTSAITETDKPQANVGANPGVAAKVSSDNAEDTQLNQPLSNDISAKKELVQTPIVLTDAKTQELDVKASQTQFNTAAIAQQAPTKALEVTTTTAAMAANELPTPFGKPEWSQAVNQKVVWMVGKGEQSATLTLNPPDMGPLKVVIQVENDQVDTTFISDNPEVRQALQDGMQMLRDKMQDTGMQLGNAQVSSQAQSQRQFEQAMQQRAQQRLEQSASHNGDDSAVASQTITRVSNGLVDTFA